MFRELEKNQYRIRFIEDNGTYNGFPMSTINKYCKRHDVFKWHIVGIDLRMINENSTVRFTRFRGMRYVVKSWRHRIQRKIYMKIFFIRGRKLVSCIYQIDKTGCQQEQTIVRFIEILPKEVIMDVYVHENKCENVLKYHGKVSFQKLRRSERLISMFSDTTQFKLPMLNM